MLSGSDIEIDKTQNGVFNVILNAITAGEIGKITTNEGKLEIVSKIREIIKSKTAFFISISLIKKQIKSSEKWTGVFAPEYCHQLKQFRFIVFITFHCFFGNSLT